MSEQAHAAKPAGREPAKAAKAGAREGADSSADLDPRAALRLPTVEDRQATFRASVARRNETGLPDRLKAGLESLSGFSMDDVRVHYGSSKPAGLGALAYAKGRDIHLAPGQERHLPHEAWHVVQQKQGRVRAAYQLQGGDANSNAALEHEASVMGSKATSSAVGSVDTRVLLPGSGTGIGVIQPVTAEQKAELELKLARDKIKVTSISFPKEGLALVNGELRYHLYTGFQRWGPKPEKKSGDSFYGRLGDTEISTLADLSMMVPRLPIRWVGESDGDEEEDDEARESEGEAGRMIDNDGQAETEEEEEIGLSPPAAVNFTPSSSSGGPRNTGDVMGKYFFSRPACLSATDYLLADQGGFEWLHMQADSLGGPTAYGNLYAGGGFANTHMAAIEKSVDTGRKAGFKILVSVTPTVDNGHHSSDNCVRIVDRVRAKRKDKQNPFGQAEIDSLRFKPSQKLHSVSYRVSVGGSLVWEQHVQNLHLTGFFDKSLFAELQREVTNTITGGPRGPLSVLNTAGSAGTIAASGAASGRQGSASSAGAMDDSG